jgi:hypothetical protein
MNEIKDSLTSSFFGVARTLIVDSLNYPLYVIKTKQQCSLSPESEKGATIAKNLFHKEGFSGFYRGLSVKLTQSCLKPVWQWPLITNIPLLLERYRLTDFEKQTITGFSIASIDATIATPLERVKILRASGVRKRVSLIQSYKEGWKGYLIYLQRQSVFWISCLTIQEYFRNQEKKKKEEISSLNLVKIGVKTGISVSVIGAPFDIANTLKQTTNKTLKDLFKERKARFLFRGWPLQASMLTIHNIGSAFTLNALKKTEDRPHFAIQKDISAHN